MKAAIDSAMTTAAQRGNNETCTDAASGDIQWHSSIKDFRRKRYYLQCHNICMGPARAFPEYFPPEFDFESFDRRIRKHSKKKKASRCKTECLPARMPAAYDVGLQCEFCTHIPLGYAPQYLKSHERYCGCRDELCPNKRSVASHEPCK